MKSTKMLLRFLFMVGIFARLPAGAVCLGENMDSGAAPKNTLLSTALADLDGFNYVRSELDNWKAQGLSLCASGVALEKNIYQYFRFFIQIEVRAASGELKALVPVLFQTASVQAHDNTGPKPWTVMPNFSVQPILAKLVAKFNPQYSLVTFPTPVDTRFLSAVLASPFGKGLDTSSFFVTPLTLSSDKTAHYYLASWMEQVAGTGGGLYTQQFAAKILLFKYLADGSVQVDQNYSGFSDVLTPLDSLLSSIAPPYEIGAQKRLLLKYSEL
jgi:hypothetical protein